MNLDKALVGIAGSVAVIVAIFITGTSEPLWALILVAWMVSECNNDDTNSV